MFLYMRGWCSTEKGPGTEQMLSEDFLNEETQKNEQVNKQMYLGSWEEQCSL